VGLDVASAMTYLHSSSPPKLHLDLKSPNILLQPAPGGGVIAKVADFGMAHVGHSVRVTRVVNPVWLAPEVLLARRSRSPETPITKKADVYAFGVILYELLTRSDFIENVTFLNVVEDKIISGYRPVLPKHTPYRYAKLVSACWDADPDQRPAFIGVSYALSRFATVNLGDDRVVHRLSSERDVVVAQAASKLEDSTPTSGELIRPKSGFASIKVAPDLLILFGGRNALGSPVARVTCINLSVGSAEKLECRGFPFNGIADFGVVAIARDAEGAVVEAETKTHIVVFGGSTGDTLTDAVVELDLNLQEWTVHQCSGVSPPPMQPHTVFLDKEHLVVVGGILQNGAGTMAVHHLDLETWAWKNTWR
jgi:Protein tyrosine and serine/threonine kinase